MRILSRGYMTKRALFEGNNFIIKENTTSDGVKRYIVFDQDTSQLVLYTTSIKELRRVLKKG